MRTSIFVFMTALLINLSLGVQVKAQVVFTEPELFAMCEPGVQELPYLYKVAGGQIYYGCNNEIFTEQGIRLLPSVKDHFKLHISGSYAYNTIYSRLENQDLRIETYGYGFHDGNPVLISRADYQTLGIVTAASFAVGSYYIYEGNAGGGTQALYSTYGGKVDKLLDAKVTSGTILYDDAALFSATDHAGNHVVFTKGSLKSTVILATDDCSPRGGFQGMNRTEYYYSCYTSNEKAPGGFQLQLWLTNGSKGNARIVPLALKSRQKIKEIIGITAGRILYIVEEYNQAGEVLFNRLLSQLPGESLAVEIYSNAESFNVHEQSYFKEDRSGAFIPLRITNSSSQYSEVYYTDGTIAGTVKILEAAISANILGIFGNYVFMNILDDAHGAELWMSEGSAAGTKLVADIMPGNESAHPEILLTSGRRLYFRAKVDSDTYGLYRIEAQNCTQEVCGHEAMSTRAEDDIGLLPAPGKLRVKKRRRYHFILDQGAVGAVYELKLSRIAVPGQEIRGQRVRTKNSRRNKVRMNRFKAGKWFARYRIKYGEYDAAITSYSAAKRFRVNL